MNKGHFLTPPIRPSGLTREPWHPRTHVRMCSNILPRRAPHPRTAKGVSKPELLRPHKHKLSAGNYEIQLTSSFPPSSNDAISDAPTVDIVVVVPSPLSFSSVVHHLGQREESLSRRGVTTPFHKQTKQNCVDRLIVIYIPLG